MGSRSPEVASAEIDRQRIARLAEWFGRHARDLPWRRQRNGYGALVAEAMLQQTQVSRVVERYQAFMTRFPNVEALAAAPEREVLALWQGLGYYRRARNLRAAARAVVERFGGEVPDDADRLRQLPGVGRYTAGAIASIVHDRPEAILDGNARRVLARWNCDDRPVDDASALREAWDRAGQLVQLARSPAVLNEALMELGAVVCTPRAPRCDRCPVAQWCGARRAGRQDEIPPPKASPRQQEIHHHAVIVVRRGRMLVEQRPDDGMWSGLWQTPTVERKSAMRPGRLASAFAQQDLPLSRIDRRGRFDFQTTHRRVTFHVFEGATRVRRGTWHRVADLHELPMSNAHRRVIEVWSGNERLSD